MDIATDRFGRTGALPRAVVEHDCSERLLARRPRPLSAVGLVSRKPRTLEPVSRDLPTASLRGGLSLQSQPKDCVLRAFSERLVL